jgi:hypothetical protein
MARFGVGVMHNTIKSRFGPKPLVHADYAIGLACRTLGNAGAIQPSLRKSATPTAPYVKVVRALKKL